mmetsp:Transcript_51699/g.93158  ORF Transcript_51699/g.93158 Transcript_51699/m.93158 type:complete len:228 (-) Transcript_51699:117-800(-)
MHLEALGQCLVHNGASWQPTRAVALDHGAELLSSQNHGLLEARVLGFRAAFLLPARVQAPNTSTQVGTEAVAGRIGDLDSVVQSVQLTDHRVVGLGHDGSQGLGLQRAAQRLNHRSAKVLEDQASAGELDLGVSLGIGGCETLLVVVITMLLWLVGPAHIHDYGSFRNLALVPRPQNGHIGIGRQALQHGTCHSLVCMEGAMVRADELAEPSLWELGMHCRLPQSGS